MFISLKIIDEKILAKIAKDYYLKIEKINNLKTSMRKHSINSLENHRVSVLSKLFDFNYNDTLMYLNNNDFYNKAVYVSMVNDSHEVAYAVIKTYELPNHNLYIIDDIIINDEEELEPLAGGEISMSGNIYRHILNYIEELLQKQAEKNYIVMFDMVDNEEFSRLLLKNGYVSEYENVDDNSFNQAYSKSFTRKRDNNDELRLTLEKKQK